MDLQKRPEKRPQTDSLRQQHDNQQGPAKRPRGRATISRAGSRALSKYSARTPAATKPRAIVDAFAGQRSMPGGANRSSPPEDDQYANEPAAGSENNAEDFEDLPGSASVPLSHPATMPDSSGTAFGHTPSTFGLSGRFSQAVVAPGHTAAQRVRQREQEQTRIQLLSQENEILKLRLKVRSERDLQGPFTCKAGRLLFTT